MTRYELALELNGTETGQRQAVHVVCPPPMLPMPGNLSCGCEAGLEPTESGECVPCSGGHYKAHRGMDLCDPCEVGMFQPITGQRSCVACARGSFQVTLTFNLTQALTKPNPSPNPNPKPNPNQVAQAALLAVLGPARRERCGQPDVRRLPPREPRVL